MGKSQTEVCATSFVDPLPAHHPHSGPPVFVDVKPIDLNVRRDRFRQARTRSMKAERGRYQINQGRLVVDLSIAKQLCRADVATATMRFDAAPVVDTLKDVFAIFAHL